MFIICTNLFHGAGLLNCWRWPLMTPWWLLWQSPASDNTLLQQHLLTLRWGPTYSGLPQWWLSLPLCTELHALHLRHEICDRLVPLWHVYKVMLALSLDTYMRRVLLESVMISSDGFALSTHLILASLSQNVPNSIPALHEACLLLGSGDVKETHLGLCLPHPVKELFLISPVCSAQFIGRQSPDYVRYLTSCRGGCTSQSHDELF